MGSKWVILGRAPIIVRSGSVLGPFWVRAWSVLGLCLVRSGSVLGPFWVRAWSVLGPFWVCLWRFGSLRKSTPLEFWSMHLVDFAIC